MVEALICRRCGAPLPPGLPGHVVTCPHCGTSSRIGGGDGRSALSEVVPGPTTTNDASGARGLLLVLAAVFAVAAAFCSAGVLFMGVSIPEPTTVQAPQLPEAPIAPPEPPPAPRGLPWTALETAESGAWVVIEPPPPTTPPWDFAPDANIEWAETIARAWSPDAVLVRMDVDGIRRDGGLDLVNDADASIRYVTVSPIRLAAAAEMAKVSHEVPPTAVVITIEKGEIKAMIDDGWGSELADGATPPVRSACTMAQLLAAGGDELPERPDHDVRLDWRTPYEGLPAWLFDVDSSYEVFPDDCTKWSLKAARARK